MVGICMRGRNPAKQEVREHTLSSPLTFQRSIAPLHQGSNLQHVTHNSIQTMAFKSGPSGVRPRVQSEQALGSLPLLKWLDLFPCSPALAFRGILGLCAEGLLKILVPLCDSCPAWLEAEARAKWLRLPQQQQPFSIQGEDTWQLLSYWALCLGKL